MVTMAPVVPTVSAPPEQGEHRVLIRGVDWRTYSAMRELTEGTGVRMAYFQGVLEIMSPSSPHEICKKMVARLLELYALERDIALYGYGSTTFRHAPRETGLEPDECYTVGRALAEFPDLAIEVALSSGGLPKLELYQRLRVREVWFWVNDGLSLFTLAGSGYEPIERSLLLPELDVALLARFVREQDQAVAVREYRAALRSQAPTRQP